MVQLCKELNYTKSKNEIKPQQVTMDQAKELIIPNQRTKSNHNTFSLLPPSPLIIPNQRTKSNHNYLYRNLQKFILYQIKERNQTTTVINKYICIVYYTKSKNEIKPQQRKVSRVSYKNYTKSKNEIKPQLIVLFITIKKYYTKSKNEIKPQLLITLSHLKGDYTKSKNEIKPQLSSIYSLNPTNYTKSKNEIKPQHINIFFINTKIIPNQRTKSNHN